MENLYQIHKENLDDKGGIREVYPNGDIGEKMADFNNKDIVFTEEDERELCELGLTTIRKLSKSQRTAVHQKAHSGFVSDPSQALKTCMKFKMRCINGKNKM